MQPLKTNWMGKNDPFVREAFELANYQVNVRKKAIKAMETNKQIIKKTKEYKKEVIADFTDWTYGCMALTLHRMHGWGAKRIARLLEELEQVRGELMAEDLDSSHVWDRVRDEVRLDIKVVDGDEWRDEL